MRSRKTLLSLALLGAFALSTDIASAYCRASTCSEGLLCGPPPWDDPTCKPLAWMRPCVGYSLTKTAAENITLDVAEGIVETAFSAWETASCDETGTTHPSIQIVSTGAVACDLVEYNTSGGNANIIAFRDIAWPHPTGPHNIALTTVTYDNKTGEIYDADMEINSATFNFTLTDENVDTDLLSVVTHEAGHFIGMAHSEIPEATMWANYTPGTIDARTLSPDDTTLVCVTYEPTAAAPDPSTCNPIPRHGFSEACLSNQTEGDCSIKPPRSKPSVAPLLLAFVAAAIGARRARSFHKPNRTPRPVSKPESVGATSRSIASRGDGRNESPSSGSASQG